LQHRILACAPSSGRDLISEQRISIFTGIIPAEDFKNFQFINYNAKK